MYRMQASQGTLRPTKSVHSRSLKIDSSVATARQNFPHLVLGVRREIYNALSIHRSGEHQPASMCNPFLYFFPEPLTRSCRRVEEMARELETLRNQREENGLKSTISPETQFDSPDSTLEQSGTAVVTDFGSREQYQLGEFVIDRNTVIDMFKM